jgi:hypothetical protein
MSGAWSKQPDMSKESNGLSFNVVGANVTESESINKATKKLPNITTFNIEELTAGKDTQVSNNDSKLDGPEDVEVGNNQSTPSNIPSDLGVYDKDLPLASDTPVFRPEKYEVKVEINSLTMHNDHDPWPKGKGEIVNYAYIQGHRAILNTHIDSGYTKFFNPPREVTVYLGSNVPLSIFTVGIETDFCTTGAKLEDHPPEYLSHLNPIFGNPNSDWLEAISNAQKELISDHLAIGECNWDRLGTLKEFYEPIDFQKGIHEVKSSSGDFTLRYTVYVTSIQP